MEVLEKPKEKPLSKNQSLDYSLVGLESNIAIEKGLVEAQWYSSPIDKSEMRKLLRRKDKPAIVDTILWLGLIFGAGIAGAILWGSWWAIIPFLIYGALYASSSDARWHESSHGTAFKTDWMNNALYEVSSFMVLRESTPWRWSHNRHHSDTIIVGRDPEIAVPRPPKIGMKILGLFNIPTIFYYFKNIIVHAFGEMLEEEKTYIPETEFSKVYFKARIYLAIYLTVIVLAIAMGSFLPLMFIGLPNIYGAWLMSFYGLTQHSGLAENVLDHRLNCRTVYMNRVHRFLYWNMGYHLEHHMYPLVPYHQLPRLHELMKDDCPPPYPSLFSAWKEIIPAIRKQVKDPSFYVKRELPKPKKIPIQNFEKEFTEVQEGWARVCEATDLMTEDTIRFDYNGDTFAIYKTAAGEYHATDGMCTHGNAHLSEGFVKGDIIECPKHNGRFDVKDGSTKREPACIDLVTYQVEERKGNLWLNLTPKSLKSQSHKFTVRSNENVSTFIKELILEAENPEKINYQPGDYIQLKIPNYGRIDFKTIEVKEPYHSTWQQLGVYDNEAINLVNSKRNYSIASNPNIEPDGLRFNVRIATPPLGHKCSAGSGSSYVFSLKAGDKVTAVGPFGDFHIKNTEKEMVYIGGGAGMAPLRAHISHLFETQKTDRKVSFWYGARSKQEMFYENYFKTLESEFHNFSFYPALSEPLDSDGWSGHKGFIHEVVLENYLKHHPKIEEVEFYLCGPPMMVQASKRMFSSLGVASSQVSYDEFT